MAFTTWRDLAASVRDTLLRHRDNPAAADFLKTTDFERDVMRRAMSLMYARPIDGFVDEVISQALKGAAS